MPKSVVESKVLQQATVRLSVSIDSELWIQLTTAGMNEGLTKAQIVDEALRAWLDERTDAPRRG